MARLLHVPADQGKLLLDGRMQLKVSARESEEAYTLCLGRTPPGLGPPLHVHALDDQTHYVLTGTYELVCGPDVVVVGPGACVHMPRYMPHTFRNVGEEPAELVEFTTPGGIDRYFDAVAHLGPYATDVAARNEVGSPYGISFPDDPEDYLEPPPGDTVRRTKLALPGDGRRVDLAGHEATRKIEAEDAGGLHTLTEVALPAGAELTLDEPRQVALVALEGCVTVESGDERADAERGDSVAVLSEGTFSIATSNGPAKLLYYTIEPGT